MYNAHCPASLEAEGDARARLYLTGACAPKPATERRAQGLKQREGDEQSRGRRWPENDPKPGARTALKMTKQRYQNRAKMAPKMTRNELPEAAELALPGSNTGFEEGQEDGTTRASKWTPNQARRDPKIAPQRLQNGPFRGPKRALKGARGGQDGMFPTRSDRGQGCSPLFGHSKAVLGPLRGPKLGP